MMTPNKDSMKMGYAIIAPDEDGNPIIYVHDDELKDINLLMEDYGIKEWVKRTDDPMYWEEGQGMLVKIVCVNPTPKKVISEWEIPDDTK